jgi:glycerol-3-phosphate cytidylyltransferase
MLSKHVRVARPLLFDSFAISALSLGNYLRKIGIMIVYTVGTFDLLHVGHVALLNRCKALGDVVAVGVASDEVVNIYKPNVPIIPLAQRIEMLGALGCVDIVRPYYELEYVSACRALNVDIFVIGEDWGKGPHNIDVEEYLSQAGKKIVQVHYSSQTSSTKIKQAVISQFQAASRPS